MKIDQEVSGQVFEIFYRFTPLVEPLSIDEAFLDVTGCIRLFGNPVDIAKNIKEMVRKETGLTVSAGVAHSNFNKDVSNSKRKKLNITLDSLQDRFGENIVRPATLIDE